MAIVGPSATELADIAADLGFHLDAADVSAFREMMRQHQNELALENFRKTVN